MTRRKVLAALSGAALSARAGERFHWPPGLQGYSFRREISKDVEGTLALIQELGFKELEITAPKGMTPAQFRKRVEALGMKVVSTGTGWEQFDEDTKRIIGDAQDLGAKYIMCPGIPHKDLLTPQDCELAVSKFNQWGEQFREAGIHFVYHPHGPEFRQAGKGILLDILAKGMKPGIADLEMDTFWVVWSGYDPVKMLHRYPGRWVLMHLKDVQKGAKGDLSGGAPESTDVAVGTGQAHWPAVFRAAKESVEHYFIEDGSADPVAHVRESLRYLRGLTKA